MKTIKQVVVTYADDTTETLTGVGHINDIRTQQTVEFWNPETPDAEKPETYVRPVHYYTIGLIPNE